MSSLIRARLDPTQKLQGLPGVGVTQYFLKDAIKTEAMGKPDLYPIIP